jgi:hypothetical protein
MIPWYISLASLHIAASGVYAIIGPNFQSR